MSSPDRPDVTENGGTDTQPAVPRLSLTVSEHAVTPGAIEILKVIRPDWHSDSIRFKLFTDGITNKLVGCFYEPPPSPGGSVTDEDVVLIRVYGNKTEMLIDRRTETENIQLLHRYGYAPALYATFTNGLAYEYVPGVTLTTSTCRHERIWPLVARRMAQMHKVSEQSGTGANPVAPALPAKTEQFLQLIPSTFSDPIKNERVWKVFPRIDELRAEFEDLYRRLLETNSPIVFCHNDLLLGNVIYDEERERVTFIDYEYAAPNHQAFDIGNHFTEFAGIDDIDYGRYPDRAFQLRWLGEYIREYRGIGSAPTEGDVQRLYVQVNQYALASHFHWAVWALIQAEHSTIDFDFVQFGTTRFLEYRAKRDEFLGLRYTD
ncbi:ethanolamine kinase [Anopheles ziemanni]|uniref:ethanolamine kinase n=1 Tax=Anopheles coustani TaxID=139045 RepID=UPI00265B6229|nr:ethanolamine kinase [Anopheles coustani]XP_058175925.1 ethanolamine kinase [Anopheles ziemanni]